MTTSAFFCGFGNGRSKLCARCNDFCDGVGKDIKHNEFVPRLSKIARHGAAHIAQADKSDFHFVPISVK